MSGGDPVSTLPAGAALMDSSRGLCTLATIAPTEGLPMFSITVPGMVLTGRVCIR